MLTPTSSGPSGSNIGIGISQSINLDTPYLARKSEADREEALLCPGGRLLNLNVSGSDIDSEFARVLVPYPAAGNWFLTILPTCARLFTFRRPQDEQDM